MIWFLNMLATCIAQIELRNADHCTREEPLDFKDEILHFRSLL